MPFSAPATVLGVGPLGHAGITLLELPLVCAGGRKEALLLAPWF